MKATLFKSPVFWLVVAFISSLVIFWILVNLGRPAGAKQQAPLTDLALQQQMLEANGGIYQEDIEIVPYPAFTTWDSVEDWRGAGSPVNALIR